MRERWKGNSIKKADDEKDQTDFGEKGSRPSSHRDAGPMWGVATASPRPRLDRGMEDAVGLEGQIEGGRRATSDQDWVEHRRLIRPLPVRVG
jgi:hypothetical protein